MVQPLFFEPDVQFAKVAAEVMLPEDPNEWPNELMQELFKQVPYISDFEPHVTMDRVDAERGYGFGHVEVQNKTEIQHGADPAAMASAGVKNARIPVVIKDRKLQPLDLLITTDSKILPLTESRLRSTIFRPQAFDVTGRGPGDMSMVGQLYPPMRNIAGMGGGGATMSVGMGKESAVKTGSVLTAILPSINESDYEAFFDKLANDRGLKVALGLNPAAADALHTLAAYEPMPATKLANTALDNLRPSVAQLRKEEEGYSLKTASHACWMPKTACLSRGEALRMFGPKVVIATDQTGAVTMAPGEGAAAPGPTEAGGPQQNPEKDTPELITQFGIYKVKDEKGTDLIGYVFPNLIDIDGKSLPIALFTNGSQKSVQSDIVGINVGGGASIPEGHPQGTGCFYQMLSNGRAQALVPMTLKATVTMPGEEPVLHGETYDGTPVQVSVQPNITEVTLVDDHLLVPDTFSWMPLDKAQDTHLVENPEGWGVEAEAKQAFATVQLRCGGHDSFALEGFPVDKLASAERQFMTLDETMFLLGGLGVDLAYAQAKIGEAAAWSKPVPVRVGRYIKMAQDLATQVREKTAEVTPLFAAVRTHLRKDLLKEAAVIPDPAAVDTVLSLGFLNPENLGVFISYIPVIDGAQAKMCELLLAARVGLRDIPVGALEKAVKSTEEALEGLKVIAFQKQ